jgi:hypothetical protein
MKASKFISLGVGATAMLIAFYVAHSQGESGANRTPEKVQSVTDLPIICHVEKRDKRITVKAGPNGLVYQVATKAGKILYRDLSENELQAKAPELYQFIKMAIVRNARPTEGGAFLDARLRISTKLDAKNAFDRQGQTLTERPAINLLAPKSPTFSR